MSRLTPEELAQLGLMRDTLWEMYAEVSDMPHGEVYDVLTWLAYLITKMNVVRARHGLEIRDNPPPPSVDDYPF